MYTYSPSSVFVVDRFGGVQDSYFIRLLSIERESRFLVVVDGGVCVEGDVIETINKIVYLCFIATRGKDGRGGYHRSEGEDEKREESDD